MPHSPRQSFRLISQFCLMLLPAVALLLSASLWPAALGPGGVVFATLIAATLAHLCAWQDLRWRGRFLTAGSLALSLLGLAGMLAATALIAPLQQPDAPFSTLPAGTGVFTALMLRAVAASWLAGLGLALLCRMLQGYFTAMDAKGRSPYGESLAMLVALLVLSALLWLTLQCLKWHDADLLLPEAPVRLAIAALFILTASSAYQHGVALLTLSSVRWRPSLLGLGAGLAVAALAVIGHFAPAIAVLGPGGSTLILALAGLVMAVLLAPHPLLLISIGFGYLSLTPLLAQILAGGSLASLLGAVLLLLPGPLLARPTAPDGHGQLPDQSGPGPAAMARFNQLTEVWLARLDLPDRMLHFPWRSGHSLGYGQNASFAELFIDSQFSGILDLMQAIQQPDDHAAAPLLLQLRTPQAPSGQQKQMFQIHILERRPDGAWLALSSQRNLHDLTEKAQRSEERLSAAILREERLLSVASHELRTPVAILSMLAEELKSGMSWADIGPSFDKTLTRVVSILDDLRADSGAEGGMAAQTSFTMREMVQQLTEMFSAAAAANGITLGAGLSAQANLAVRSDYGRVFFALSKLVQNAITHSKASQLQLDCFLTMAADGALTMTWQVSDNGIGIAQDLQDRLFEPFESGSTAAEDRPGLGLYSARKAVRLIGGDLTLQPAPQGSRFVLSHPARADTDAKIHQQEQSHMTEDAPAYPELAVLLVEDNKLVGEITSARLQKLFHRVDWAEAGDDGLMLVQSRHYDFIIVDQLLPGMLGSELVQEIRKTNANVPIIGITASTMGSECQDLEAAGVNYALEKPLSFTQIKGLAQEFFGPAAEPTP